MSQPDKHQRANYKHEMAIGVFILAWMLILSGCGLSSATPQSTPELSGAAPSPELGTSLRPGLIVNLNNLDSYRFTSILSGPATPDLGAKNVSGTVINRPLKEIWISDTVRDGQLLSLGDRTWLSFNGGDWAATDPAGLDAGSMLDLLPNPDYAMWFDSNASKFFVVGEESKNGVDCLHYQGDASLGDHSTLAGSSIHTEAELWVAKDGLYPVSGTYSAPSGDTAQSGSFSYTFDVTYINDATLIQAIPTPPDK